MNFHLTELEEFKAGDVYRMNDFNPFADAVILGLSAEGYARVARPYVYASLTGTTGCTPLMWAEVFDLPVANLRQYWKKMGEGRVA
jgi:hypothetical protein